MTFHTLIKLVPGLALVMTAACGGGDTGSNSADASIEPDAGPIPDARVGGESCKRVDLLFSIDASESMLQEIAALSDDVFPLLADQLRDVGGGLEDYRIGVIDACPAPATLHTRGDAEECNFQSGQVWMDSYSTALTEEFSCVADMYLDDISGYEGGCTGDQDDDERPAWAAYSALTPPFIDEENAGFLRDDALLVVVAITDEDEETFDESITPQEIYDNLVSIKGDVDQMVFLGIGGATACDSSQGQYGSAQEADTLKAVTDMFIENGRGVFWDLCSGALENGLSEAMEVIEGTCNVVY